MQVWAPRNDLQKDDGLLTDPFFSPNVAKHCERGICSFASWGQHAHVPSNYFSGMLYYTRYRDCGDGVLEVTWMMHNSAARPNFAGDTWEYLNVPWGGVRTSTLKDVLLATSDGNGATLQTPLKSFSDNSYIPNLMDLGGYTTFAQDLPKVRDSFQLPCGDGTGAIVDCSSGTPPTLILKSACAESASHTSSWGRYTLKCTLEGTVNLGSEGWREGDALEFSGGSRGDGKIDVAGVLHWSWAGNLLFIWPEGTAADFNSKFATGDEIFVSWLQSSLAEEDNLALTFVHGTDADRPVDTTPARIRFGAAGSPTRDYTVWTVNVQQTVSPSHSYWNRQFIISGRYKDSHSEATAWVEETAQATEAPTGASAGRGITLYSADGLTFAAALSDDAQPCSGTVRCVGRTSPASGWPPLFAISCGVESYVGADLYALSPSGLPRRPYQCSSDGRPEWRLLGYFEAGACATLESAAYDETICA